MFQAPQFAKMKKGSFFICVSRGKIYDGAVLVDALKSGHLQGAGLDVTDPEPLPPDHPLYETPNLLVVPHIGSATTTARAAMADRAVDNLLAALDGKPMPYAVQPPA